MLMLTFQPCLPPHCPSSHTFVCSTILFSRSLMTQLSSWYTLLSSTTSLIRRFVGAASFVEFRDGAMHGVAPVFDQTFCWCCLLCGVHRWCHAWWTDSGAQCPWFSRVESIFHSPTLARSRHPHLTLSSIAHWGACPGLAPCLVLDSVQRILRIFDW